MVTAAAQRQSARRWSRRGSRHAPSSGYQVSAEGDAAGGTQAHVQYVVEELAQAGIHAGALGYRAQETPSKITSTVTPSSRSPAESRRGLRQERRPRKGSCSTRARACRPQPMPFARPRSGWETSRSSSPSATPSSRATGANRSAAHDPVATPSRGRLHLARRRSSRGRRLSLRRGRAGGDAVAAEPPSRWRAWLRSPSARRRQATGHRPAHVFDKSVFSAIDATLPGRGASGG